MEYGTALTGADVAYSINWPGPTSLIRSPSNVARCRAASAKGTTVTVKFGSTPAYSEWQDYLVEGPVVPSTSGPAVSETNQIPGANKHPGRHRADAARHL